LVGRIVVRALELEKALEEVPIEEYAGFSELFGADLYDSLRVESALDSKQSRGGTSPARVTEALARARKDIDSDTTAASTES
jgi:argininosuccinate lyase